ncbi:DUF748 domain-containing protein [Janthinobacterium sp. B9-8]|uniref:DUF748 domain-containing protein n=1 Tax=Janthinobacterium sp. B9-8 TaxID=1236179 RepID=UPI00061CEE01|nr:DUF748 domain-containing protein [Janthinobacterium sp. B9-8]AMC33387.1 hypothetical protein VN23_01570 [Janthinobacterium sp. B9-8]
MERKIGLKFKRWLLFFGLFLSLLGLVGGMLFPRWAEPRLEAALSKTLHRTVSIEEVTFNPFILKATLHGVSISKESVPFARFQSLVLDIEWASLWKMAPIIKEITLTQPQIDVIRLDESKYNFSDLIELFANNNNKETARFSLNNIRIINGTIIFNDQVLHTQQKLTNLELALPFVSTLAHRVNDYIQPSVSGKLNGTVFKIDGESKPFSNSLDTRLTFNLQKLNISQYTQYIKLPNELKLLSAYLSGQLSLQFHLEKDSTRLQISGPLQLEQFNVELKDKPFLKVNQLSVSLKNLEPLAQIYRLSDIKVDGLDTTISKNDRGELNWLQAFKQQPVAVDDHSKNKNIIDIKNIKIVNSRVAYENLQFNDIKADVAVYSNQKNKAIPVLFSARTAEGEVFSADLKVSPQPFVLDGKVSLTALELKQYMPFISPYFNGIVDSGQLDLSSTIHFSSEPLAYSLKDTDIKLQQFSLHLPKEKKSLLKAEQFAIKALELDSKQQLITVAAIESQGGQLGVQWLANGQFNFSALIPRREAVPASGQWRVQVAKVDMSEWQLDLSDKRLAKAPSIPIRDISLVFDQLDTAAGSKGKLKLSAHWADSGLIDISGDIVPMPFSAQIALDLRKVNAAFLQPYFTKYLNISLARGFLNAKGNLQVVSKPDLNGRYRGAFSVDHFYAIDKQTSTAFLKWNRLDFKGVDAALLPLRVDIAEVALDKFFSRLILSPTGRLNLQDILVQDGKQVSVANANTASAVTAVPVAEQGLPPVQIKKIILNNGDIRYSDFFIKPNFTANLTKMTGTIAGLSSAENARAQLDLQGFVDKTAPVKVSGELNPLSKKIFLDLKGGVKNYDLTSASTYSTKYAGYGIEKGKMSMDIAYRIEGGKLIASNNIFLDQLNLSEERIEGKDATTLPVKLALALLTDRRGQVKLNLPIEGSLDDPQFSVSGIIWQVIGNVLEKVVTSPFDALASSLGHEGAVLSHVDFIAGSEKIDDKAIKSIQQLAEILADRPALKLDVQSVLSLSVDGQGLKKKSLQRKIRLLKMASVADSLSQDEHELMISQDEYPSLLEKLYKSEKFTKPTNLIGMDKALTVAEMEKLIFEHTEVKNDDLYALGLRRALLVKSALLVAGVDEARIFLVKPRISSSEDSKSRVKFDLK